MNQEPGESRSNGSSKPRGEGIAAGIAIGVALGAAVDAARGRGEGGTNR